MFASFFPDSLSVSLNIDYGFVQAGWNFCIYNDRIDTKSQGQSPFLAKLTMCWKKNVGTDDFLHLLQWQPCFCAVCSPCSSCFCRNDSEVSPAHHATKAASWTNSRVLCRPGRSVTLSFWRPRSILKSILIARCALTNLHQIEGDGGGGARFFCSPLPNKVGMITDLILRVIDRDGDCKLVLENYQVVCMSTYHVLCHVDQVVSRVHTWPFGYHWSMVSPPWWPIWTEVLHATFSCFDRDADGAISLSELSNGHLLGALSMEDPRLNGENSDNFEKHIQAFGRRHLQGKQIESSNDIIS